MLSTRLSGNFGKAFDGSMIDQPCKPDGPAKPEGEKTATKFSTPGGAGNVSADSTQPPAKTLTPDEQMALFERELKENDWGHQPC